MQEMVAKVDDSGQLVCPYCHETYLHQDKIRVYNRLTGEDSSGLVVTIQGLLEPVVAWVHKARMTGRRQSLEIEFECEHCEPRPLPLTLVIYQHKGNTRLHWRG